MTDVIERMGASEEVFGKAPIFLFFLLDTSASMRTSWETTLSGFNEYVDHLRATEEANQVEYFVTLVCFDSDIRVVLERAPLDSVPRFTSEDIKADGSATALYDGIGRILELSKTCAGSVLNIILTDGHENHSRSYNGVEIKRMIQEREASGNHTFVYLGAEPAAWKGSIGIASAANTLKGVRASRQTDFATLAKATEVYTCNVARCYSSDATGALMSNASYSTTNFFTSEQTEP